MKTALFRFDEIFAIEPDGVPAVERTLVVAGIPFSPGTRWRPGFRFAGWDIANHIHQPLVAVDDGTHLTFLGFAALDNTNPDYAKGWLVTTSDEQSLHGFYPTEYLAKEAKATAGEGFVVYPGLKRFGNNDEFITHSIDR